MKKRIFKWALRLGLIGVALILLLLLLRNPVARIVLERRIHDETGMEVRIGKFSAGMFSPTLTIKNLKLYNTAEFGRGLFLDVPEFHVEIDAAAMAHRKIHLTVARLNLAEVNVVRNEAGQTNLFSLLNGRSPGGGARKDDLRKLADGYQFDGIDKLTLSLGKARFIDLKDPTRNRELSANLENQVFKIRSEADFSGMAFMILLRSGGFSVNPADLLKSATKKKNNPTEIKTNTPSAPTGPIESAVEPDTIQKGPDRSEPVP
jgi:hypothetical protein